MAGYREFQTGEVLTAGNVNNFLMNQAVMVFADGAARTTALSGVLAEGMLTYNLDTQALEVYDGTEFVGVGGAVKEKRIEAFTGSGTFVVPAGVTYAIAHCRGGGGGIGPRASGNNGGDSSVAFASGTITGPGNTRSVFPNNNNPGAFSVPANSGLNAIGVAVDSQGTSDNASSSQYNVGGASVTPGASIAVTVGAGGAAGAGGGHAGGSGYVYIEYFEEV